MQAIAGRRDERAFAVLYDRYGPRMHRYFYRMLGRDAAKAEDFTQDLFIRIIEKPHLFDTNRNFRSWIYTLALNLCKNEYRRNRHQETEWAESEHDIPVDFLPESIDKQLFESLLREAVEALNDKHRPCFILRYQEELSVAEIAEILELPEGTVKSRLFYALRQVSGKVAWFNE